jgi:hypothetical protein
MRQKGRKAKAQRGKAAQKRPKKIRLARCFTFFDGELKDFDSLEGALKFAGAELTGAVLQLIDETSTVVIAEATGELSADQATGFGHVPALHRRGVVAAGLAMMQTLSSRDPVLVVEGGDLFVQIVANADRMERFIQQHYSSTPVPLAEPPATLTGRWVVSIAENGALLRTEVNIAPRPGIGRA